MSNKILKINNHTVLPLDGVKLITPLYEDEQRKISERLNIDASLFKSRITLANGSSQLARESIAEIEQQIGLVNLGDERFVPAANILLARVFSRDQAARLRNKGYNLSTIFRSSVETSAGMILSSAYPAQIMERRARALSRKNAHPSQKAAPSPDGAMS